MAAGLIQEAVNLPSVNPKYKFGLLRSRSDAAIKRSVAFKNVKYQRMCSESNVRSAPGSFQEDEEHGSTVDRAQATPDSGSEEREELGEWRMVAPPDDWSENKQFLQLLDSVSARNGSVSKLSKRESLKAQKKTYRREKKKAAKELLSTLKDPSVILIADWLKVRGSLKGWTKLWCVLKPGLLLLYKSLKQKSGHWVGTVLLNTCELIERPSKKDGFCFKLFHPLDMSIWGTKGPKGETIGAITQPLPYSYLIFRAPSETAGKCWMDALELTLRCSTLLMRSMVKDARGAASKEEREQEGEEEEEQPSGLSEDIAPFHEPPFHEMNESDCERHFKGYGLEEDPRGDKDDKDEEKSDSETEHSEEDVEMFDENLQPIETSYVESVPEELGQQGDACQTEEVADENKSLIWSLVKQVRPGMDLSRVVLPTFILEPRSFLEKLADYYYHADFLTEAVKEEDPYSRIKAVVRWYISGFYKKPKGLKKPYNPIIGEIFRCYWKHPTGSRTFYMAEQISHHPPVSAFYVTNRQDGFSISGGVLAKSKFYGNSLSAILDGVGRLTFLKRGEDYLITMPYAHCKGILIGTLTMEMGGKVSIVCEKTGYRADIEFKLKPFLSSSEASNKMTGKIKLGSETLATLEGHWDQEVYMREKATGETTLFWNPTPEIKAQRMKRFTVPLQAQNDFESEKLWLHVSEAIQKGDQQMATHEKFIVEEAQRKAAKERELTMQEWVPRLFERNPITEDWLYKYIDLRPWDPMNDVLQYETNFVIQTKTRHRTPIVRSTSIMNVHDAKKCARSRPRQSSGDCTSHKRQTSVKHIRVKLSRESGSSTPDLEGHRDDSDSSDSRNVHPGGISLNSIERVIEPLIELQRQNNEKLTAVQNQLVALHRQTRIIIQTGAAISNRDVMLAALLLLCQVVLFWLFK